MILAPEEMSAVWLTERLREAGHGCTVRDFTAERIGTGQIGMCIRYCLNLDGDGPASLIGKFPSPDPQSRATGVQLRNYLKEVNFYQQLQHRLSIRTPKCYFADINDDGPEFMLLLEDLSPAVQGDQLEGCTPEVARSAVLELIGLHAPMWNDPSLSDYGFLGPGNGNSDDIKPIYQALFPGFIERYGSHLDRDQTEILKRFGDRLEVFLASKHSDIRCPIHIDYRLDNMLINETASPTVITVVDWQSITVGNPLTDVAYFLGAGLLAGARREREESIVHDYHDGLQAAGIHGYDWMRCWEDYRRATFAGFSVTVVASMLVQQTQRGDQMFIAMAQRHSQHALDQGAMEFLE